VRLPFRHTGNASRKSRADTYLKAGVTQGWSRF